MFHRPPKSEDNVHNIVCGKGIKVLLKNKVIGASLTKAAWSPCVNHFLSHPLTLSFRLVPIWTEVCHVYLFAWVSKT